MNPHPPSLGRLVLLAVLLLSFAAAAAAPSPALAETGPQLANRLYGYPYPGAPDCNEFGSGGCVADQWQFFQGQCTSWTAYRLNQLNGFTFKNSYGGAGLWGDASNWKARAQSLGIPVNGTPAVGAVAWYSGHVAYVEEVRSPTSIVISEMNYDNHNAFRLYEASPGNRWPAAFLHVHDRPTGPPAGTPNGHVDVLNGGVGGFVQIAGWTVDPDAPTASTAVHVYVGGPAGSGAKGYAYDAANSRPDVGAAFPGVGDAHGFSMAIGGFGPGDHAVYVYAINAAGGGDNPLIGSGTIHVPAPRPGTPFGAFDTAVGRIGSKAGVTGWTIDPDVPTAPTQVHAYIDGPAGSGAPGVDLGAANGSRPDVGKAFPGTGDQHGLAALVPGVPGGRHTIWLYAINAGGDGDNPLLGTRSVDVPGPSPIGHVDLLQGAIGGFAAVQGWVLDPDGGTTPTSVHVYVDGPAGSGARAEAVAADLSRPDVADAYPGAGDRHGFSAALGGVSPGTHSIYVYAINNAGAGDNLLLASGTINVPGAPAGTPFGAYDLARPLTRGGAAEVLGWTVDPDAKTAPTTVHVYVDGPAGSGARGIDVGAAKLSRPDVAKAFPGVGEAHGFVAPVEGLKPGRHVLWVYAINAAGAGDNPLLGARDVTVTAPVSVPAVQPPKGGGSSGPVPGSVPGTTAPGTGSGVNGAGHGTARPTYLRVRVKGASTVRLELRRGHRTVAVVRRATGTVRLRVTGGVRYTLRVVRRHGATRVFRVRVAKGRTRDVVVRA